MDNIQKSVVAVLCVAVFAALIIPSESSVKTEQASAPEAPVPTPQPVVAQETADAPAEGDEFAEQEEAEFPDEFETFGQPMNDAQPLGTNSNSSETQSQQTNLPAGALNGQSANVGQNYADQVAAGSTDAPIRTNQPVE